MSNKNKVLISASIAVSLLAPGYSSFIPLKPSVAYADYIVKNFDKIYETKEWAEVEKKWNEMDEVKVSSFGEVSNAVEKEKKSMEPLYASLIKGGYLSRVTADGINLVYGENLRRNLEADVQLPCCYKPMMPPDWDWSGADTKEELKGKLAILEEIYATGSIKKDVYEEAKNDINNRITLLEKADKYWHETGEEGTHAQEKEVLLHLYGNNIGGVEEGKDVLTDLIKASEYIVKLENLN